MIWIFDTASFLQNFHEPHRQKSVQCLVNRRPNIRMQFFYKLNLLSRTTPSKYWSVMSSLETWIHHVADYWNANTKHRYGLGHTKPCNSGVNNSFNLYEGTQRIIKFSTFTAGCEGSGESGGSLEQTLPQCLVDGHHGDYMMAPWDSVSFVLDVSPMRVVCFPLLCCWKYVISRSQI